MAFFRVPFVTSWWAAASGAALFSSSSAFWGHAMAPPAAIPCDQNVFGFVRLALCCVIALVLCGFFCCAVCRPLRMEEYSQTIEVREAALQFAGEFVSHPVCCAQYRTRHDANCGPHAPGRAKISRAVFQIKESGQIDWEQTGMFQLFREQVAATCASRT